MVVDDVLTFFHTFERVMNLNHVERSEWPRFLPVLLNSKPTSPIWLNSCRKWKLWHLQASSAQLLSVGPTHIFEGISKRCASGKSYKMFETVSRNIWNFYTEAKYLEDIDSLADAMLAEQFLETLPTDRSEKMCHIKTTFWLWRMQQIGRLILRGGMQCK